ncbi:MAG: hypothetical protein J0H68_06095 [Sphingobacteriia bacterium]|nr:hypothetical protein [Sphingobacteriia bacterium]
MNLDFLTDSIAHIWLIVSTLVLCVELIFIQSFFLIIVGIAGLITAAALYAGIISSPLASVSIFGILSVILLISFWGKIQKLRDKTSKFNDIKNTFGVVIEQPLIKGTLGKINWSGTIVNASLLNADVAELNETVKIVEVKGNTFFVIKE